MSPAFKEWHVIVEALGRGEQALILRKGGIAEGRGGFDPARATRFWLFPTFFHAQREKTKPAAARWFAEAPADGSVTLRYFAETVHHAFLRDPATVAALDPFHLWAEEPVRERFEWSREAGLHAMVVRVYRLQEPLVIRPTAEMGGCKSWIELESAPDNCAATPVMAEETFEEIRKLLFDGILNPKRSLPPH